MRARRGRKGSKRNYDSTPPSSPTSPTADSFLPGSPERPRGRESAKPATAWLYGGIFLLCVLLLGLGLYSFSGAPPPKAPPQQTRPRTTAAPTRAPTTTQTRAPTRSPSPAPTEGLTSENEMYRKLPTRPPGSKEPAKQLEQPGAVAELSGADQPTAPSRGAGDQGVAELEGVEDPPESSSKVAELDGKDSGSEAAPRVAELAATQETTEKIAELESVDGLADNKGVSELEGAPAPAAGGSRSKKASVAELDGKEDGDSGRVAELVKEVVHSEASAADIISNLQDTPVNVARAVMLEQAKIAQQAAVSSEAAAVQARKHADSLLRAANELGAAAEGKPSPKPAAPATAPAPVEDDLGDLASEAAAALAEADSGLDTLTELMELDTAEGALTELVGSELDQTVESLRQESQGDPVKVSLDSIACSSGQESGVAVEASVSVYILKADLGLPLSMDLSSFQRKDSTSVVEFAQSCSNASTLIGGKPVCLRIKHLDRAAKVFSWVEVGFQAAQNKHTLVLLSNDALRAVSFLKSLFPRHPKAALVITSQSWSAEDSANSWCSELYTRQVCSAHKSVPTTWPPPQKRARALFQLSSYSEVPDPKTPSKKLTPVFLVRWKAKSRELLLNAEQLALGWATKEHQARLFGSSSHGFQYRIVDKQAGIVLTMVIDIQTQVVEVLCNDKDFALNKIKRLFLGIVGSSAQSTQSTRLEDVFAVNGKGSFSGWSKQHKVRRKFVKALK